MINLQSVRIISLAVTTCLMACSAPTDSKKNLEMVDKSVDTNRVISLIETFSSGKILYYSKDDLGQTAASIHHVEAIPSEIIDYFFRDKNMPELKGLAFYGGEKCKLNDEISLYTLYAVKDIPFGNVALYVFSFSKKKNAKVIDVIKLASYEENEGKTLVEEGEIKCDLNEIKKGSTAFSINDAGGFNKKVDN